MNWFTRLFGGGATDPVEELNLACARGEITEEQRDRKIAILTIDDEYELEQALEDIKLRSDPVEKQIVDVKRKFAAGELTENERDKEIANIRKEPYVNVISMGIEDNDIRQGYFELDWNDHFVIMLQDAGITGTSDDDVVNMWFNGVCRTVLLQEGADLDYGLNQENE
jgi:hypothetical protein